MVKNNEKAPNFKVVGSDLKDVSLFDFDKKIKVLICVPSIDTDICDKQAKKFSQKLKDVKEIVMMVVSMDLPFAQKRWCAANNIENLVMVSDYKYKDFVSKYDALSSELHVVKRAVIVIDENNKIKYAEYCKELSMHPNYDAAFSAIKELVK